MRRVQLRLQTVGRDLHAIARTPLEFGAERATFLLLENGADAELAGRDEPVFVLVELFVAVGIDVAAPGIAPEPAFIGRIGVARPAAIIAGDVGAVLALGKHDSQQHAKGAVREGVAVDARELVAIELGHEVLVTFEATDDLLAILIERACGTQVHEAADGAFRQRSLGALDDIGSADDVRGAARRKQSRDPRRRWRGWGC